MSNLLHVSELSKEYNQQVILDQASFNIGERQKIAVIGRNGAGKSTLFRIITGQEEADSGNVMINDQTYIGYLKQEDDFEEDDTVLSYLLRESDKEEWECSKVASQFELKNEKLDILISALSGGYQMRVKLTLMLLKEPNLILLDEPTNYLDLSTLLLLEKFLINYRGSYMIISHDRRFIANTCNEVIEIERGKAYHFPNSLERYFSFKQEQLETAEKYNKKQDAKEKQLQNFIDRFGAKASKASQAKAKASQIKRLDRIEVGPALSNVRIRIQDTDETNGFAWRLKDLTIGYGEKKVAKEIFLDIEKGNHIAILGDNGQGKSTFLKTLAEEIEPLDGECRKLGDLKISYYAQHVALGLDPADTVTQHLEKAADHNFTDEEIFKMAGNFLFRGDELKKTVAVLSGGEKARLCLAGILLNKCDVLLLDEPTNHLDFETVEVLANSLVETNVTIMFISHDRTFIGLLADEILEVKDGSIRHFSGNFNDYVESLENRSNDGPEGKKEVVSDKDKELRRILHEEKKKAKREFDKLEKKLGKLKNEKKNILNKFAKNPTNPDSELTQRLKEIEVEIKKLEEDWIVVSDKLEK